MADSGKRGGTGVRDSRLPRRVATATETTATATFNTANDWIVAIDSQVAACISSAKMLIAANRRVSAATARPGGIHAGIGQHSSAMKRGSVFRAEVRNCSRFNPAQVLTPFRGRSYGR